MDWTQQGNPERDLFEAALGGSHKCTLVRRSKSSEGGTSVKGVSHSKYRVGKFTARKSDQKSDQLLTVGNVTPTLLATIWDELSEAERSHINQIVVHYLQMNIEESVEAEILPEVI